MSGSVQWSGLGQVARSVSDIEQSLHFYGEQLGLPLLYRFGALAFFDLAGVRLLLSQAEQATPESILYLRVGDIHATCEQLQARGVTFLNMFGIGGAGILQFASGRVQRAFAEGATAPAEPFVALFIFFLIPLLIGLALYLFSRD